MCRQDGNAYLVAGGVDGDDSGQSEIPLQVGQDKGGDEAAAGSVDVDGDVQAALLQEVVDALDVLVVAGVSGAQDDGNANGVLVNQVHGLRGINGVPVGSAVDVLLLDLEVARGLFPADLHGGRHDDVWLVGGLALGLALELPAALHGQHAEHDGLGGADAGRADAVAAGGSVEELADHVDAAVLDVGGLGVLLVVDEVFGEGLGHELLGLFFLYIFARDW